MLYLHSTRCCPASRDCTFIRAFPSAKQTLAVWAPWGLCWELVGVCCRCSSWEVGWVPPALQVPGPGCSEPCAGSQGHGACPAARGCPDLCLQCLCTQGLSCSPSSERQVEGGRGGEFQLTNLARGSSAMGRSQGCSH